MVALGLSESCDQVLKDRNMTLKWYVFYLDQIHDL